MSVCGSVSDGDDDARPFDFHSRGEYEHISKFNTYLDRNISNLHGHIITCVCISQSFSQAQTSEDKSENYGFVLTYLRILGARVEKHVLFYILPTY